jgi:hypothetical protein
MTKNKRLNMETSVNGEGWGGLSIAYVRVMHMTRLLHISR